MHSTKALKIKSTSIREQVYEQIKKLILDGSFPAGMRLDLSDLCTTFNISKTPLTEALQKLTRDGLVTVKPRSGTFVSKLDRTDLIETFEFRLAIEIGAAEMITRRITDRQVEKLREINRHMYKLLEGSPSKEDLTEFLKLDAKFHDFLISTSGNRLISDHYRQVSSLLLVIRMRDRYSLTQYRSAVVDHDRIVDSLAKRDCEAIMTALKQHIAHAVAMMLEHLSP